MPSLPSQPIYSTEASKSVPFDNAYSNTRHPRGMPRDGDDFDWCVYSEIDGLQAGVNYLDSIDYPDAFDDLDSIDYQDAFDDLDTIEKSAALVQIHPDFLNRVQKLEGNRVQKLEGLQQQLIDIGKILEGPCGARLACSPCTCDFGSYKQCIEFEYQSTEYDRLELSEDFFPAPNLAQEQPTSVAPGSAPTHSHEESGCVSQQYAGNRELPTINEFHSEEALNVKMDEPPKIAQKVPQNSQWATLQELRLSSRAHYLKFLSLTANHSSRGIKMLRRMYGSPKGILDAGIATFRDVLDGQESQSLKGIFAFTCLSYVMSNLLQKHGRMEGSRVLADTSQWRQAIKKEKNRLVYDEAVNILWPEYNFFKQHTTESDANSTPLLTGSYLSNSLPLRAIVNSSSRYLYVPSPRLAYDVTAYSDINFLEKAWATDSSSVESYLESALKDSDNGPAQENQPHDHGLHDYLTALLQQTSTDENFMFADFLNFCGPQLGKDLASEEQTPDITQATGSADRPSQMLPSDEPVGTLNPNKLSKSSPTITGSEILFQTESLSPKVDEIATVAPLLEILAETIMFQVVVEFMKFIISLGDLLFHLSGCGLTSRCRKYKAEDFTRPIQEVGEFVTGAVKLVLEPIKEDLGKIDESVDAVLSMAGTFVRLGRLHTVREIEEYIITTARYLTCDYTSFITVVSKTLKRCLAASDQMTWDHIYPSYATDQEYYSTTYIKKIEAIENEWALQKFKKDDDCANKVNFTKISVNQIAEPITRLHENDASSNSDPPPSKKQKASSPSPNSNNDRQFSTTSTSISGGDILTLSRAQCQYANCKKSYTGNDARVNLRRHIRTVHEGAKTTKCPACGHESSRRDNVRKHFLLKHKSEKLPAVLMCKTRA